MKKGLIPILLILSFTIFGFGVNTTKAASTVSKIGNTMKYTKQSGLALSEYPDNVTAVFNVSSNGSFTSAKPISSSCASAYSLTYISSKLVRQDGMYRSEVTYKCNAWDIWGGESTGTIVVYFYQ